MKSMTPPAAPVPSEHSTRNSAHVSGFDDPQLYRQLVDSVADYAIILLDTDGCVSSWNEGAQRIIGYAPHEILGRSFEAFYPPEAVTAGFPKHELQVAERDGRFEDENWRLRKDGSRFWANVVVTALHDAHERLVGFGKVTRDLTARRQTEEQARQLAAEQAARAEASRRSDELQRINEQLESALADTQVARDNAERSAAAAEAAYREVDQFAYVASHDLKAPLRGIASLAQWIQDDIGERLTGDSADHMRLLQGRVHRMQALIDGVLAYSRAGRTLTTPEPVDTGTLVREAVELLAPPDEVKIQLAPHMPRLQAERVPLQQVFMNLIDNAIKYARGARPDVLVEVAWRDLENAYEFSVRDNGPGIAQEYQERIWGIFQTLAPRDKVEGTGIGLSVVKKIVESRSGRVWVESESGQGATFCFTWPKVQTRAEA
jgi:PAS domain S-box-containing protein